jgi:hypothetical protein
MAAELRSVGRQAPPIIGATIESSSIQSSFGRQSGRRAGTMIVNLPIDSAGRAGRAVIQLN